MQPQSDPFIAPKCHEQIRILYQDEHLLLINKPSGLLSLSGKHPLNLDSVHHRLKQDFPSALMIHRLDFGTSGIMLIALNKEINKQLCRQFSERSVTKTYTAMLDGVVQSDNGLIDLPIAKGEFPLMGIDHETGKPAKSQFEVIERFADTSKVAFTPLTGRTHQLRVHSQAMGHSILGCDLYADDQAFFKAKRLMLHATSLSFTHPVSHEALVVTSPCPF